MEKDVRDRFSPTYFEENKRPFHNMGNSMVRAAIQSLFAGLILHNLGMKDRRDFEFRLQLTKRMEETLKES